MDEYIKREEVLKIIADNCPHDKCGDNTEEEIGAGWACCYIRKGVENIPTADVAPMAEVAREIFEEIEKVTARAYNDFMFNRDGVGMMATLVVEFSDELDLAIAELKKKYTEGNE